MAGWADMLFVNAQVFTTDTRQRVMEAVATRGKSILTVGTTQEILELKGPRSRVVDLTQTWTLPESPNAGGGGDRGLDQKEGVARG